MKIWRIVLPLFVGVALLLLTHSDPIPAWADYYDLRLTLQIPVIVDNMKSLGRRVYKIQHLRGTLAAYYYDEAKDPYVTILDLYNKDYKINKECVTYSSSVSEVLWRAVGDNKKEVFRQAAFGFRLDADPSYNIGSDEPDNTLILNFAGKGSVRYVTGYVSGQIGCGCRVYGHVSPTRIVYLPYMGSRWVQAFSRRYWYPTVVDIAPCWGRWSIKFKDRKFIKDASMYIQVDNGD